MDYEHIINHYYPEESSSRSLPTEATDKKSLRDILLIHSTLVARRAVGICDARPELGMNQRFVWEAAMLHDIGIIGCSAPGIMCFGTKHYICHGRVGAEMLRDYAATHGISAEAMDPYARVCERHTGAGLTRDDIERQNLPLPHRDFQPETWEEKVICYADKFYSKTHPDREKTLEQAERSLAKFGQEGLKRFMEWHRIFED